MIKPKRGWGLSAKWNVYLWQIGIRTMSPVSACQRQRIQKRVPVQLMRAWCLSCLSEIALNLQAGLLEVMAAFGRADSLDELRFIKIRRMRSHCLCKRRTCPRSISSCRHYSNDMLDCNSTRFISAELSCRTAGVSEWAQTPGAQQVFLQICVDLVPISKLNGSLEATMWLEHVGTVLRLAPSRSWFCIFDPVIRFEKSLMCKGLLWGKHCL